jgi:hypothetical protein
MYPGTEPGDRTFKVAHKNDKSMLKITKKFLRPSSNPPIRVNFEQKPPINGKSKLTRGGGGSGNRDRKHSAEDRKRGNGFKTRNLNETYDHHNPSNSENEITDVSPLSSPHQKHRGGNKNNKTRNPHDTTDQDLDTNRINTNVFYDALHNEFNKKMDSVLNSLGGGSGNNRGGSSRPVSSSNTPNSRNTATNNSNSMNDLYNYTSHHHLDGGYRAAGNTAQSGASRFLNLDEENRRLLIKIIREKERAASGARSSSSNIYMHKPVRLTSAALNRQREQQRIERENQNILKRLLHVKGSKTTNRDEQMKDYERNFGIASLNYTRSSSAAAGGFRSAFTNSMSSLNNSSSKYLASPHHTDKSSVAGGGVPSGMNSRLSSAKSTRSSSKQRNLATMDASELLRHAARLSQKRPEWVERW